MFCGWEGELGCPYEYIASTFSIQWFESCKHENRVNSLLGSAFPTVTLWGICGRYAVASCVHSYSYITECIWVQMTKMKGRKQKLNTKRGLIVASTCTLYYTSFIYVYIEANVKICILSLLLRYCLYTYNEHNHNNDKNQCIWISDFIIVTTMDFHNI